MLDQSASDTSALDRIESKLDVSQGAGGLLCSTGTAEWSYALDGSETRKQFGDETRSTKTKWEGGALLVNTQVSGPRHFTIMDRWGISKTRNTLDHHPADRQRRWGILNDQTDRKRYWICTDGNDEGAHSLLTRSPGQRKGRIN